ncbi:DNMT1-RFD domain-containing protein [Cephalotus follicularis]|uniref:DNMT1-RFD domain-containing protein n=1 Tax=Cephalotus follicularis TaxID=3775 RepID=A0A1Q3C3B9_CEPFO|nr:DNMT1-RFD domain-containing protein [Cephalotus follicularis]
MASSDEEGEILPESVANYHFVDQNGAPISFDVLPLQWEEGDPWLSRDSVSRVSLLGTCDNGLQNIYKQVIAWKFELSCALLQPQISVLSKDKNWITLENPRRSFQNTIRTIMITLHWLHFVKMNPETCGKSARNHLLKTLSFFEVQPCENDLLTHMILISEAAQRDKDLAKSKYLLAFVEKPGTNVAFHQDVRTIRKSNFIVDMEEDEEYGEDEEYDGVIVDEEEESFFDTVCAICDNGGEVLNCEGSCLRSFHPTPIAGADSNCRSLGFADAAEVEEIPNFLCKNCLYKRHQCFACGKLGSSAKSSGQEVFPCASAICGHFYHPECVAKLFHIGIRSQEEQLQEKIATGESFTCPAHKCFVCKQIEDKDVRELQFAVCRRCPKAYHRKCLPREITFQCINEHIVQRAWEALLPRKRILIYCLEHEIDITLLTPPRHHLMFPHIEEEKKRHNGEHLSSKEKAVGSKRSMVHEISAVDRSLLKKPKHVQKVCSAVEAGVLVKKIVNIYPRQDLDPSGKPNKLDISGSLLKDKINSSRFSHQSSTEAKNKLSLRNNTSLVNMGLYPPKPTQQHSSRSIINNIIPDKPVTKKLKSSRPLLDDKMKLGILALMKEASSTFNVEEFMSRQKIPSTHANSSKNVLVKNITLGLVEGYVQAVRTALKNLEDGRSIEEAKTVCEPYLINQLCRWKKKFEVYLAPFLHGRRYTSYGRHFTKLKKLEEIVDRLHWYVQPGDMIVDFCCGSNDFSRLMKGKLENMATSCSFKNYDLIQPKNDFCFEKRDWMSVNPAELPDGSKLIMGLNPPFGVKAALANQFIDKALQFKPKLIVLIVPKETNRLNNRAPYDLIWEDNKILSGKSFYLPGSVDVNDHQLDQWNKNPPPLYLWSRTDWTIRHKAIAQEHGHIYKEQEVMHGEDEYVKKVEYQYVTEENLDTYGGFSSNVYACGGLSSTFDDIPEDNEIESEQIRASALGKPREGYFPNYGSSEGWTNNDYMKKQSFDYQNEMQHNGGHTDKMLQGKVDDGILLDTDDMFVDMEISLINSPINYTDHQRFWEDSLLEAHVADGRIEEEISHDLKDQHHGQFNSLNPEFHQLGPLPPLHIPDAGSLPRVYLDPGNCAPQPDSHITNPVYFAPRPDSHIPARKYMA